MKRLKLLPHSYLFVKEAKSIRGIPDIIMCINGKFVALETKRSEEEALEKTGRIVLQRKNLSDIRESKGYSAFIYPENEADIMQDLWGLANAS